MGFQSRAVFILALIWLLLKSPATVAGKSSFFPGTVHPASSPDSLYLSKRYDRFIAPDKAKHFTASLISTVFCYKIFEDGLNLNEREGKIYSLSITIGLGLSKEFYDQSNPNNYFSWKDLLADIAGIAAGFILVNQP